METYPIFHYLHFKNPTVEQENALNALEKFVEEDNPEDFFILCGAAGTGKTSITSALIGYLNSRNKPYKIAAPTGRAARILGRKSKSTSATIHSLIYSPNSNYETGKITFKLKDGYNQKPTVYIIDEASMISKEIDKNEGIFEVEKGLIYDLISYIKGANVNNKILFLGDHYQLPPIGEKESSALNKDFLEKTFNLSGSIFLLIEVKRQEDGSYILENAQEIRKAIDENKPSILIRGKKNKNIYAAANNYVSEYNANGPEKIVAIGVSHKANQFFNDLVRKRILGTAKKILEKNDLMMITQNWYRNGINLYNGDHVLLLEVDWGLLDQVAGLHFIAVKIKLLLSEAILR